MGVEKQYLKVLGMGLMVFLAGCYGGLRGNNQVYDNSGYVPVSNSAQQSYRDLDPCIKELMALRSLSPSEYQKLAESFSEVSDINKLYGQIKSTASEDSKALLQMAIESKTKVLCAKVRYSSVLSTEEKLKDID